MEESVQLKVIHDHIPGHDKKYLSNFKMMAEVWQFLDQEYRKVDRFITIREEKLHSFKVSTKAKKDPERFFEL